MKKAFKANCSFQTIPLIIGKITADETVPFETAELYTKKMIELGKKCTLIPYLGGKHGFINYKSSSVYTDTFNKLDEFLVSLGYLKGASPTPVSAK